ncbi:MAG: molybdenum cofactor guanylyltransferase [Solirubrobacterales bacterium]|jgi:molybdopterin-guanine dinucleotide biosynthesis protein A|nr:molybdenum cofactor guanylyltransferase [Solirubrobacterales bacterium]
MGSPKAMVELASRPLVSRVVAAVGSAGLDPIVVAKPDSPLPKLDCRVLSEPSEPRHPLTGVLAVLGASAGRGVVAIACDMPLVPSKLLGWLAQLEEPVAVCEVGGRLEPLLGRYSPEVSETLRESLEAGAPMREAVAALDPYVIPEERVARFGDPARIFFNVNTPEDLAEAEKMLGHTGRFTLPMTRRPGPAAAL